MNITTYDECLIIPINNPHLIILGKVMLPICIIIFISKVIISKQKEGNILLLRNILKIEYDNRDYHEIFINLLFIWLFCGQFVAGITTILYSKNDKRFIEAITNKKIDELSIYMPRFLIDEIFAVPIRYLMWSVMWQFTIKRYNLSEDKYYNSKGYNYYYILIKGLVWSINIWFSLTCAALLISIINYTFLDNSPIIKIAFYIDNLKYSCEKKFIYTLFIRLTCDYIQIYISNYVLSNQSILINCIKEKLQFNNYNRLEDDYSA